MKSDEKDERVSESTDDLDVQIHSKGNHYRKNLARHLKMKNTYSVLDDYETKPVMFAIHDHCESGKNLMSDLDTDADERENIFSRAEDFEKSEDHSEFCHDNHNLHRACLGGYLVV